MTNDGTRSGIKSRSEIRRRRHSGQQQNRTDSFLLQLDDTVDSFRGFRLPL